jgi:hypothetical protein
MPVAPGTAKIVLDTLGKLYERGYGLFGTCSDCALLYRMDAPAEHRIAANFDIALNRLIEGRGADSTCIRMAAVSCPRCGSLNTEYRIAIGGVSASLAYMRCRMRGRKSCST